MTTAAIYLAIARLINHHSSDYKTPERILLLLHIRAKPGLAPANFRCNYHLWLPNSGGGAAAPGRSLLSARRVVQSTRLLICPESNYESTCGANPFFAVVNPQQAISSRAKAENPDLAPMPSSSFTAEQGSDWLSDVCCRFQPSPRLHNFID